MSKILKVAKEILDTEAKAISAAAEKLDSSFENAVSLIQGLASNGHVITSGMGKAGFVAMKTSATFASVGIPSFFLHPAEAVHGDIGRYTKFDLALIFSNSGETPEVMTMLPHVKQVGCPIIVITGEKNSTLAQYSDVSLCIGETHEVGPLNIAPTTSTTVMLAMGDALAMTVLEEKGLTREEYAFFHPGGSIGRSLLKVENVMRAGDEMCVVSEEMLAKEVLHQITLTKSRPGAAVIVNKDKKLSGIFTDGDLRRCLEKDPGFLQRPIKDYMGKTPKTITRHKLASEAIRLMTEFRIDQIIVVNSENVPEGVIDIQDIVG